ncbi:ribosome small subunit-dependent GTPase A [Ornithinibacillus sp. L9]|uniref:Small ribosomal subunit biogenesis GTPase RsgA n=1 Tax=Ornithinibacillus caprae TaxID=2678566 RepID=A0A6N8FKY4_9BACI|nr:ribosome small subunit-dependent GTPase A [Ornithinibacillus caprae]MUK89811.1 ribosome small subunit-dependent GTPase A [Ornithinibacillus caprae]
MRKLENLGWEQFDQTNAELVARVITVQKNSYRISDGTLDYIGHLSGKFINEVENPLDFPAVGDWVEVQKLVDEQKAVIKRILPRKSKFVRQVAGLRTDAQIIAANIDTVFIVNSINQDLNVRRIERYILLAYESGAKPIIVLTKKDTCSLDELELALSEVENVAIGVPIITVSNITGEGIEEMWEHLLPKKTAALLGSSGVGKSTLVNTLLSKEVQLTNDIREEDSKGRHTTTHREMFMLPNGALLIDTPGMRELQLWDVDSSLDATFEDVEVLEKECRFNDCQHDTEPGCRVQEAIEQGELSLGRYRSYLKLKREIAFEKRKQDKKLHIEEKNKWKKVKKSRQEKYKLK